MARYADTSNYTQEELELWPILESLQGKEYKTAKGMPFTFRIKGNELFVSRKVKSITRAAVNAAYRKAVELGTVTGPKKLCVFGASYLYPIFLDIGICTGKESESENDF